MKSKLAFFGGIGFLVLAVAFGLTLGPPASHQALDDQVTTSTIVQGKDLETVSAAVHRAGGEITHELGIINAVCANLTPSQMDLLRADAGITSLHGNRNVETATTTEVLTVVDEFDSVSYDNNDGTNAWAGSWVESGDDNNPGRGSVLITGGDLSLANKNRTLQRKADLTDAVSAELHIQYSRYSFDKSTDYVSLQVSADGGTTWTELERITGPGTDGAYKLGSYDITGHVSPQTLVRFCTSGNLGSKDKLFVDSLEIVYAVETTDGGDDGSGDDGGGGDGSEPPELNRTVRDEFSPQSYRGNDGTEAWTSGWTEVADDDNPVDGNIYLVITDGSKRLHLGEERAQELTWLPEQGAYRRANLSGASYAELTYIHRMVSFESGDFLTVEVSADNGATFTEVGRHDESFDNGDWHSETIDISAFISDQTVVRFMTRLNNSDYYDYAYLDNVQIAFDGEPGSGDGWESGISYPEMVEADQLHLAGVTGVGVTVAVLDTGYTQHPALDRNIYLQTRVFGQYDAINDQMSSVAGIVTTEENGHGTHVTSLVINAEKTLNNSYYGIAPNAGLISVKAFDMNGAGTYADVIRGIGWIVENKDDFGIRVINCSFSAPAQSCYWNDPLNQAVMAAWQADIVVVASSGNRGPDPMTIGVPGNVPYVITVGAMSNNYSTTDDTDDFLASFSSTGPTAEGFVKPEVVAPGGHIWSIMPSSTLIAQTHPSFQRDGEYFTMSGTSQSTAIVTGVVALMLSQNPDLTPDEVKSRLIDTARPAVQTDSLAAYGVLQQGAGMVNAYDAVYSTAASFANSGLNIDLELQDLEHYGGPVNQHEDGTFYIMEDAGSDGCVWDGSYSWTGAYLWSDAQSLAYLWSDALGRAYLWSDAQGLAYLWSDSQQFAYLWSDAQGLAYLWSDGLTEPMSINAWVPQE